MVHPRFASALTTALVLVGGSLFAYAQMGPDDDRLLPYQGTLEVGNGTTPTDTFQMRFGLFTSENADAACLLGDPTTCSLWGEEQTVDVTAGKFATVLGESTTLTDTILGQDVLFLAIAVQGPGDAIFSALGGKQEILPVPFASRAAAAKDYKVTGALTAGSVSTSTVVATGSVSAGSVTTTGILSAGSVSTGAVGATAVTASGRVTGGSMRVGTNNITASGATTIISGGLQHSCGSGWRRYGMFCIEEVLRGGAGTSYSTATRDCHNNRQAGLCPIEAILTCDTMGGGVCGATTDSNQWLVTSTLSIDKEGDVNAFDHIVVFNQTGNNASNEVDVASSDATLFTGAPLNYFCCRNGGGR